MKKILATYSNSYLTWSHGDTRKINYKKYFGFTTKDFNR